MSNSSKQKSNARKLFLAIVKKILLKEEFPLGKINRTDLKKAVYAEVLEKFERCFHQITEWVNKKNLNFLDPASLSPKRLAHFLYIKKSSVYTDEQTTQHLKLYVEESVREDVERIISQVSILYSFDPTFPHIFMLHSLLIKPTYNDII